MKPLLPAMITAQLLSPADVATSPSQTTILNKAIIVRMSEVIHALLVR